ncbi:ABC transporter ATP-binding protein [Micromonospora coxensis]|uniref:ABC transporter ATP-binding protein n=1 Tax=Micromonospora coxensis TaxID=356852 RepID=UPI00344021C7
MATTKTPQRRGDGRLRTLRRIVPVLSIAWHAAPASLVAQILLGLLQASLPIAVAWSTRSLVDGLPDRIRQATVATACLIAVAAASAVLPHLSRYVDNLCQYRVALHAQDLLAVAVNGWTGLRRFEDPAFQDRLRYAQQTVGPTSSQALSRLVQIGGSLLTAGGLLYSVALVSRSAALLLALAALPIAIAEFQLARRRAALMWDLGPVERRELFFSGLITGMGAAKEIRLFALGDFLRARMRRERLEINALNRRQDRHEVGTQMLLGLIGAVATGGGLALIVTAAVRGTATVGDVALFVTAVTGAQAAVVLLATSVARCYEDLMVFEHFQAVTGAGPDLPLAAHPQAAGPLARGIELRDVWFRYSPEHPWILKGVTLHIPAGRSLALVGRNGAGKSTLVKLLCRFYDPVKGQILWDGVDIRDLDVGSLRERISAVFQDAVCYDLTARENIAVGDVERRDDLDAIRRAARQSGSDQLIDELPHRYETLLTRLFKGPDDDSPGVELSGGQWQRLAIARVFLRGRRELLILDEPSKGLDAISEEALYSGIRTGHQGETSVVISHRMSTARAADMIAVIDAGRVAEVGSHAELMATNGIYREMFHLQARGYQSDGPYAMSRK